MLLVFLLYICIVITTLRIKKEYKDRLEVAIKWYSIISVLNDFNLPPLEIKLLAFIAVEGTISSGGKKDRFCSIFNSTKGSVDNSIGKMYKKFFLIKKDGKLRIHPQLFLDFNNSFLVQLNISNSATNKD